MEKQFEVFEQSFEVSSPAKLVVKNISGNIHIIPGEDGVIKVYAAKHLDRGNPEDTEIEISQESNGTVKAVARVPEGWFGISTRPCKVDFKIEAPVQSDVRVKAVSSSIEINGFSGRYDLHTVSGKISGKSLQGEAKVSSVSGSIRLKECDFSSLNASTVSGGVAAQTVLSDGPYTLKTVSGRVQLIVPADVNCRVHASGVSGCFSTDLPVNQSRIGRRSWDVKLGEGGPEVQMSTVSGGMQVLSSFDAKGSNPSEVRMSREAREKILTRLSEGEISVDEALRSLS